MGHRVPCSAILHSTTDDNIPVLSTRLSAARAAPGVLAPALANGIYTEHWRQKPEGDEPKENRQGVMFLPGCRLTATVVHRVPAPSGRRDETGIVRAGREGPWRALAQWIWQHSCSEKIDSLSPTPLPLPLVAFSVFESFVSCYYLLLVYLSALLVTFSVLLVSY